MNNPEYVVIHGEKVKINTDFRYALRCQEIVSDESISNFEKELGIIYTLFKTDNYNLLDDTETCLKLALKYLQGRPSKAKDNLSNEKTVIDMDYNEDMGLIISSMWSEYNLDITKEKIHWWLFLDLLNGLSSECIFNKIREIRNMKLSKIKDRETREEVIKLKQIYSLDKTKKKPMTDKEKESVENFYKLTGIKKEC